MNVQLARAAKATDCGGGLPTSAAWLNSQNSEEDVTMPYAEMQFETLGCLLSIPPGTPPRDGWPILLYLHGSGEAAPMRIAQALTLHGPLNPHSATIATNGFIVVAPQLPEPGGDVWATRSDTIAKLAADVAGKNHGDRSRQYLTGFSFGGNGALEIGAREPKLWAALWAVDPPRAAPPPGDHPIWVSAGARSRAQAARFAGFMTPESGARRVLHDAGLNHVETAANAYQDSAVYNWLQTHRSAA
jgi:poly(3-hydroxybutyrate) depolymerase